MNAFTRWIVRWAASSLSNETRGVPRLIREHHIKDLVGQAVFVRGTTDDGLLVRCWLRDRQIEVNLNPACLEACTEVIPCNGRPAVV